MGFVYNKIDCHSLLMEGQKNRSSVGGTLIKPGQVARMDCSQGSARNVELKAGQEGLQVMVSMWVGM